MKNTKHSKSVNQEATNQRSIREFSTRGRCSANRSRFASSRRFC